LNFAFFEITNTVVGYSKSHQKKKVVITHQEWSAECGYVHDDIGRLSIVSQEDWLAEVA
jgi:hypothetical protein